MKQKRRRFSPEQKAAIVRRHLADKVPISDLCDEYGLQPSVFYGWQKQVLEGLDSVFQRDSKGAGAPSAAAEQVRRQAEEIERLKARLAHKDGIIAEISEAYVDAKKKSGAS